MIAVTYTDLDRAIQDVLENLTGISELYPSQQKLLSSLLENENIFFTESTNSGKTLPAVIYPDILKSLSGFGCGFPSNPKLLFITALNSLQLSLMNNVKSIGIKCDIVTSENLISLINSATTVFFISPEVLKLPVVVQTLLLHRTNFVLKVVDEAHLGNKSSSKMCYKIFDPDCYYKNT